MHCSSLCLHCSRPYRDRRPSTPASSSTRRSSRRSSFSERHLILAQAREPSPPFHPFSFLALALCRARAGRRRSSRRPNLSAPLRSFVLRAAQPRPEPTPPLHELGRALRRPKSGPRAPPPSSSAVELRPLRRRPVSGPSPPKTNPR